jgi:hypothetical protein
MCLLSRLQDAAHLLTTNAMPLLAPVWRSRSTLTHCTLGNAAGMDKWQLQVLCQ